MPQYAGFISGFDEGGLSSFAAPPAFDCHHASLPSCGDSVAAIAWPESPQADYRFTAVADPMEVVPGLDHQFNRLVPKIIRHVVSCTAPYGLMQFST
jgi:hypothetical protein